MVEVPAELPLGAAYRRSGLGPDRRWCSGALGILSSETAMSDGQSGGVAHAADGSLFL